MLYIKERHQTQNDLISFNGCFAIASEYFASSARPALQYKDRCITMHAISFNFFVVGRSNPKPADAARVCILLILSGFVFVPMKMIYLNFHSYGSSFAKIVCLHGSLRRPPFRSAFDAVCRTGPVDQLPFHRTGTPFDRLHFHLRQTKHNNSRSLKCVAFTTASRKGFRSSSLSWRTQSGHSTTKQCHGWV